MSIRAHIAGLGVCPTPRDRTLRRTLADTTGYTLAIFFPGRGERSRSVAIPMTRDCFNTEAKRWPEAMRANDFLSARNTLTQVHHGSASETTIKLNVSGMADGQRAGLAMLQVQPNWIGIVQADDQRRLTFASAGTETPGPVLAGDSVQLRMHVADETVHYEYSLDDGKTFASLGTKSKMRFSWWKGARPALFSYSLGETNLGHADFDWVRIKQIAPAKR